MESWVGLDGKEGRINIQISAEPGIRLGTLWLEGRNFTNCDNHANFCPPILLCKHQNYIKDLYMKDLNIY